MLGHQIDDFVDHLRRSDRYAHNTILAYENDLLKLADFVEVYQSWSDIDQQTLERYISDLNEAGYASTTLARKVAVIKQFFVYLQDKNIIAEHVAEHIPHPKVKRPERQLLSNDQIDRLMGVRTQTTSPRDLRDMALLYILYDTDLPLISLVELQVKDFDGKKLYGFPLSATAIHHLQAYLNDARPILVQDSHEEKALFLNQRGSALTRQGMWLIIKKCAEDAGLDVVVTPQMLRQSFDVYKQNMSASTR